MHDPTLSALRHPPHAADAERALLGALMLDSSVIDRIGHLTPDMFYAYAHREIFQAMLDSLDDVGACDSVTLTERLRAHGKLDDIGGAAYVAALFLDVPTAFNAHVHAGMIRDAALERSLLAATAEIGEKIYEGGTTREKVDFAQRRIGEITEHDSREPMKFSGLVAAYREQMKARAKGVTGIRTHFADLDSRLGGLQKGDLIVIAGRPSMGKSAFGFQIAELHARNGGVPGLLSMEMSARQVLDRMVAGEARIPLPDIVSGRAASNSNIDAALNYFSSLNLLIDDAPALTSMEVKAKARGMKRKHGLTLLVVDYLQLMSSRMDNRVQAIEEISRSLKTLAKELDIPVIALSQLSRKCEERTDKRPILSDLRDSGAIEQDADVVMFVYREEQYQPSATQWKGLAEILIRKNRQGATGDVHMTWLGKYTRFENFAGEWPSNVVPVRRRAFGDD